MTSTKRISVLMVLALCAYGLACLTIYRVAADSQPLAKADRLPIAAPAACAMPISELPE